MKNRFLYTLSLIIGVALFQFPLQTFADHPNEGTLSLEQLMKEAEVQNFEIKEAESIYQASQAETKSIYGKFMPQVYLEGGPLTTKYDDEKNSGTALYGKADWNLYRGGFDQDKLEKAQIRRDLELKKYEAVKSKITREVSRIYYELLFLLESTALKEKAIELNEEQMKLAKLKKSSGFTSNADVIEFELREATLRSDLKMLSQLTSEKSRGLSVLLGRKDSSLPKLVKGHLTRETFSPAKESIVSRLKAKNIEIVEADAEVKMSQKDAAITKSGFLPSVDLEAKYGKIANEAKVFTDNNNYSLMLKISVPLFSGLETLNQTRFANSNIVAKEAASTRKTLSTLAEAENLLSQLSTISERLNLEEKNLSKSEEYYKITMGEYRRGIKNSPDMVGASERLLEVKIRNLEYRKDFYLTKLKIYELLSSDPTREKI